MTIPSIVFGFFLAVAVGATYHFYRGGDTNKLITYLSVSQIAFWAGQFLGGYIGVNFISVGPLNAGLNSVVALLALILLDVMGRVDALQSESEEENN